MLKSLYAVADAVIGDGHFHSFNTKNDLCWLVDVDEDGVAYTWCADYGNGWTPEDEVKHAQDYHAGKYCIAGEPGCTWCSAGGKW